MVTSKGFRIFLFSVLVQSIYLVRLYSAQSVITNNDPAIALHLLSQVQAACISQVATTRTWRPILVEIWFRIR